MYSLNYDFEQPQFSISNSISITISVKCLQKKLKWTDAELVR